MNLLDRRNKTGSKSNSECLCVKRYPSHPLVQPVLSNSFGGLTGVIVRIYYDQKLLPCPNCDYLAFILYNLLIKQVSDS
jgi:hypothetical protein